MIGAEESNRSQETHASIPRNVLYVLPHAELGGAERATLFFVSHHDQSRFKPIFLFLNDGLLVSELRAKGFGVFVLSGPLRLRFPLQVISAIGQCRRIVRDENVSLIHSCMSFAHLIAGPAAILTSTPSCIFQHGPVSSRLDSIGSLIPTQRILVNSEFTASQQRRVGLIQRQTQIVSLSTDISISGSEALKFRAEINSRYQLTDTNFVFGTVARFDPNKGVHVTIEGVTPLLKTDPSLRLMIVGDQFRDFHPEYKKRLFQLVNAQGITDQVIFVGFQEDVRPFLARFDIVIASTVKEEGFSLAVLEAMMVAKPVVSSKVGAVSELMEDGVHGLFYEAGNPTALTTTLEKLLQEEESRIGLGKRARQHAVANFSPHSSIARLESIYDSMMAE